MNFFFLILVSIFCCDFIAVAASAVAGAFLLFVELLLFGLCFAIVSLWGVLCGCFGVRCWGAGSVF